MAQQGLSEDDYQAVAEWRDADRFSPRERVAIEYAELFATDHLALDDDFWNRFRAEWDDDEILDLSVCVASFLGLGRLTQVMDAEHTCRLEI